MLEPGVSLSRLIATEKNAIAALADAKRAMQENTDLRIRLSTLEQSNIDLRHQISAVRGLALQSKGSGPTSTR